MANPPKWAWVDKTEQGLKDWAKNNPGAAALLPVDNLFSRARAGYRTARYGSPAMKFVGQGIQEAGMAVGWGLKEGALGVGWAATEIAGATLGMRNFSRARWKSLGNIQRRRLGEAWYTSGLRTNFFLRT